MLRTLAAGALAAGILLAAAVPAGAQVTKNPKKATDLLPCKRRLRQDRPRLVHPRRQKLGGGQPTPRMSLSPAPWDGKGDTCSYGYTLWEVGPKDHGFHYVFSCPSAPWA